MKLLDPLNKFVFSKRKKREDHLLGTVLVISNTGFGDTLLSTPAVKTLRKSFVKEKIIFLVNKKYSGLFLNYKYVDLIWKYSGGYFNLLSLIIRCRINNVHTIMMFHSNSPEDIFISLLSGAKNILKCTDNINHPFQELFLNKLVAKEQHNIEKKNDLVRIFNPKIIETQMSISDYFQNEQATVFLPNNQKIIGIQLGAQDNYKIWPVENIIKLSQYLISKNFFLVFFWRNKLGK